MVGHTTTGAAGKTKEDSQLGGRSRVACDELQPDLRRTVLRQKSPLKIAFFRVLLYTRFLPTPSN
jgi:hypothetical protein